MKKWWYALHGWLGLNFGLALFVVCFSGTVAVLSHEIDWLVTPALRVSPGESRAGWTRMFRAVRERYPDVAVRYANAPQGSRFAAEFIVESPKGFRERVYVDPYRGAVTGRLAWFNTQRFFRDFHRRFFWYAWWGIWIVGAFAFVLLGSAVTGLAFYKRWWAKLFVLRRGLGLRVLITDLHRAAGVWTLLFAMLIAATGIWYVAELPIYWSGKGKQAAPPRVPATTLAKVTDTNDRLDPGEWVRAAQAAIPGLRVRSIWFPDEPDEPARINGQATAWLVRPRANHALVDPYTAEVLYHQTAPDLDPLSRWAEMADPLHFGNFGGLISKVIWFAFGALLSILMPTGAYLWVRRRSQMASATRKRLERSQADPAGVATTVRRETRRRVATGVALTAGIWGLAIYSTVVALADQLAESGQRYGWAALGNPGVIAVYSGFLADP